LILKIPQTQKGDTRENPPKPQEHLGIVKIEHAPHLGVLELLRKKTENTHLPINCCCNRKSMTRRMRLRRPRRRVAAGPFDSYLASIAAVVLP